MSAREPQRRRHTSTRPPWMIALFVVVGIIVVAGVGYGVLNLVRGSSDATVSAGSSDAATEPAACVTTTVVPADTLPKAAKVRVAVYNATETSGLAAKTAAVLEKRGFDVRKVDNDPVGQPIPGVAEIRHGDKGTASAELMLFYFPGAELVNDDRAGVLIDVAIGDAFTKVAAPAQVAAQLSSPSPSASGPGCPLPTPTPSPSSSVEPVTTSPSASPGAST